MSDNYLNTNNICIPYLFAKEKAVLNWNDILVGIKNNFFDFSVAIDYAIDELENCEKSDENILELAILSFGSAFQHSIFPYINDLANKVSINIKNDTKNKLMYILLFWVYENKDLYDDALQIVEIIYDDFDFPPNIRGFVRYLPTEYPVLDTQEMAIETLYKNWENYIKSESKKWKTL